MATVKLTLVRSEGFSNSNVTLRPRSVVRALPLLRSALSSSAKSIKPASSAGLSSSPVRKCLVSTLNTEGSFHFVIQNLDRPRPQTAHRAYAAGSEKLMDQAMRPTRIEHVDVRHSVPERVD